MERWIKAWCEHGRDVAGTGGQMLLTGVAMRAVVVFALLPFLSLLMRMVLERTGRGVLRDEEILEFVLSVPGVLALLVLGGFWIGVALVEQAGLMTAAYGAEEGRRLKWYAALWYVVLELRDVLVLGCHFLARGLVIALPFVLPAVGVALWFLKDHDINYYLNEKPAEFYQAAGMVGVLLGMMLVLLTLRALGWLLALPLVLFENLSPAAAIRRSGQLTRGRRWELFGWLVSWLGLGALGSVAVTWAIGLVARLMLLAAGESLGRVAFTIGMAGVLTLLANLLVSILAAAVFAYAVVRIYRRCPGVGGLPASMESAAADCGRERPVRRTRVVLMGGGAAAAGALALSWLMLAHMKAEDEVLIIAHRGAAATAPENTMAAVRDAVASGADCVEIDVQETADGEVVVFHDSDFMKTAGESLKIWDARRADLERIDIGSWFGPEFAAERTPTLERVLSECRGKSKVLIELKYYGHDESLERKVVEIVEQLGMADEVMVMSLKYDKVMKVKAMRPGWSYGLLATVHLGRISGFDVDFLGVSQGGASRSFIRRARGGGQDVYVWTVNDPFRMSAMMTREVDGIITDDPALARRVLAYRRGLNPVERLLIGIGSEVGVFSLPEDLGAEDDA